MKKNNKKEGKSKGSGGTRLRWSDHEVGELVTTGVQVTSKESQDTGSARGGTGGH